MAEGVPSDEPSADRPELSAEQQLELQRLVELVQQRLKAGETIDVAQLVAQHPALAPVLEQRLAQLIPPSGEPDKSSFELGADDASFGERPTVSEVPRFAAEVARHLHCPHCGNPIQLVEEIVHELTCRSCGSTFQVDSRAELFRGTVAISRRVGRFELIEPIGRGGFGVVYKALDPELKRVVAVKIPRAGYFASSEDEQRFLREARHAAHLNHPGIVRVYEVSRDNEMPYIVSEFIEGETLADRFLSRRLPHRDIAELIVQVADALHFAHEKGVIHRDIKPSNVLLDQANRPYLVDFGLARREETEITITLEGEVIGTPTYMSPEQAAGERAKVDPRSDVYSLGVILYRALTGELPFRGSKRMLIYQLLNEEPKRLRAVNDTVPRDLETITMKAMAKEPWRRYSTAREMADDLRCWLRHEPIQARPAGRVERSWRWCRRNRMVASLAVSIGLILMVLAAVSTVWAMRERELHRQTAEVGEQERQQRLRADQNARESRLRLRQFMEAQGTARLRENDPIEALPWLVEALSLEEDPARWPMHRLRLGLVLRSIPRLVRYRGLPAGVRAAAISPAGDLVAAGAADGSLALFGIEDSQNVVNAPRHSAAITAVEFRPDGKAVATSSRDKTARLWPFADQQPAYNLTHDDEVSDVAFSADGRWLATSSMDGLVRLWSAQTGQPEGDPLRHDAAVHHLHFTPDSKRLVTIQGDARTRAFAQLWDLEQRARVGEAMACTTYVLAADVDVTGERLVMAGQDGIVDLWDLTQQKKIGATLPHEGNVRSATFSRDGTLLLTSDASGQARLFDARNGTLIRTEKLHTGPLTAAVFSQDGQLIATAGVDGTTQIWGRDPARVFSPVLRHNDYLTVVAFTPDDRHVVTGSDDGSIKVWEVKRPDLARVPDSHEGIVLRMAQAASGAMVTASGDKTARVWDNMNRLVATVRHERSVTDCAISPHERLLATACADGFARLWSFPEGTPRFEPLPHPDRVNRVAFSPDSTLLATACEDGQVRFWDVRSGNLVRSVHHTKAVRHVSFDPSGSFAASFSQDNTARVWRLADGQPAGPALAHTGDVTSCVFTPDSRYLVTGGEDGQTIIWNWRTAEVVKQLETHPFRVRRVTVSRAGRHLLSVGEKELATLWDMQRMQPAGPSLTHRNGILLSGTFSPDGSLVATVGRDGGQEGTSRYAGNGFARLWDTATGAMMSPSLRHPEEVTDSVFSLDGKELLTASHDGQIRRWSLQPDTRSVTELRTLARVLNGRSLDATNGLVPRPAWELESEFRSLTPPIVLLQRETKDVITIAAH